MLGIERMTRKPIVGDYAVPGANEHRWSPYEDNAGTVVSIAGSDFCVIASDTRLSQGGGYAILTRNQPKVFGLSGTTVLGSTGCWCDILTLSRIAEARMKIYKNTHNKEMNTDSVSQMISNMLYQKRFFPYYVYNIVAGLDAQGKGVVYSYDPVGHRSRSNYASCGSSMSLIQPLLDNQVGKKNMTNRDKLLEKGMTLDEAVNLIHDCFVSAAEREIHTGDGILFKIITKDGIQERSVALRRD